MSRLLHELLQVGRKLLVIHHLEIRHRVAPAAPRDLAQLRGEVLLLASELAADVPQVDALGQRALRRVVPLDRARPSAPRAVRHLLLHPRAVRLREGPLHPGARRLGLPALRVRVGVRAGAAASASALPRSVEVRTPPLPAVLPRGGACAAVVARVVHRRGGGVVQRGGDVERGGRRRAPHRREGGERSAAGSAAPLRPVSGLRRRRAVGGRWVGVL
mmetsp:Transcript_36574/g.89050  ORF Transcript_36574/g.89050 Transcript_36574/m.89050 type:complete len:217 (-) Transcript_36574:124-774(-)